MELKLTKLTQLLAYEYRNTPQQLKLKRVNLSFEEEGGFQFQVHKQSPNLVPKF